MCAHVLQESNLHLASGHTLLPWMVLPWRSASSGRSVAQRSSGPLCFECFLGVVVCWRPLSGSGEQFLRTVLLECLHPIPSFHTCPRSPLYNGQLCSLMGCCCVVCCRVRPCTMDGRRKQSGNSNGGLFVAFLWWWCPLPVFPPTRLSEML